MDGVILTELIAVLLSVLLIDFVAIVAVRCIIKKARDVELRLIRFSALFVVNTIFAAIFIINFIRIIPVTGAYIEYQFNCTKEVVGIITDIRAQNGRKIITIEDKEYVLLNGTGITAKEGTYVKAVSGCKSNYLFEIDSL